MSLNWIAQCAVLISGMSNTCDLPYKSAQVDSSASVKVAQLNKQVGLPSSLVRFQGEDSPSASPSQSLNGAARIDHANVSQSGQVFSKDLVAKIRALADTGNPDAQYILGLLYYYGLGVQQDYTQSLKFYTQASSGGSVEAMNNLAQLYDCGAGVQRDPKKAVEYFEKAAMKGFPLAAYNLGTLYQGEEGITADPKKSVYWWRRAARDSSLPAIFKLACSYQIGIGVDKDLKQAIALFERAANSDFAPAQFKLAEAYESGEGLPKNLKEAARLYLKAAMGGSPEALNKLQSMDFSPLIQIGSNPNKQSL